MPKTDFTLYPKSTAIICNGYVVCPGLVQYRLVEKLWKAYPEAVTRDALYEQVYHGTKAHGTGRNIVSVHIAAVRLKLAVMGVRIASYHSCGYSLRFK